MRYFLSIYSDFKVSVLFSSCACSFFTFSGFSGVNRHRFCILLVIYSDTSNTILQKMTIFLWISYFVTLSNVFLHSFLRQEWPIIKDMIKYVLVFEIIAPLKSFWSQDNSKILCEYPLRFYRNFVFFIL